jgi:hypothetical protein
MLEYIQKGREGKGRERITIQKSSVMKNGIAHSTLPLFLFRMSLYGSGFSCDDLSTERKMPDTAVTEQVKLG